MLLRPLQNNIYIGPSAILLPYRKTRQQIECGLARWLWQYQNGPHTADKTSSGPGESFYNKGWGSGSSAIVFKALLELERGVGPGFGFGSGALSKLS